MSFSSLSLALYLYFHILCVCVTDLSYVEDKWSDQRSVVLWADLPIFIHKKERSTTFFHHTCPVDQRFLNLQHAEFSRTHSNLFHTQEIHMISRVCLLFPIQVGKQRQMNLKIQQELGCQRVMGIQMEIQT